MSPDPLSAALDQAYADAIRGISAWTYINPTGTTELDEAMREQARDVMENARNPGLVLAVTMSLSARLLEDIARQRGVPVADVLAEVALTIARTVR